MDAPRRTRDQLIQQRINLRAVSRHASLSLSQVPGPLGFSVLAASDVPVLPTLSPLVTYPHRFSSDDAVPISSVCSAWISQLFALDLQEAFRIELCHIADSWSLRLCLHPVAWFDLVLSLNGERAAVKSARDYLEFCEREHIPTTASTREKASSGKCKFDDDGCGFTDCTFLHVLWRCPHQIRLRTDATKTVECGFPVYVEDLMADGENWALHRRYREGTRELLLMPKAEFVEKRGVPHGNIELVQSSLFWHVALSESRELDSLIGGQSAVERIVINFGQWETAERQDPYASECHAHAHLWLSKKFISDVSVNPFSDALAGCHATPQDYLRENAKELRDRRIGDLRLSAVESNQEDLKGRIATLETKMDNQQLLLQQIWAFISTLSPSIPAPVAPVLPAAIPVPTSAPVLPAVATVKCVVCGVRKPESDFSKNQRTKKDPKCTACIPKPGQ